MSYLGGQTNGHNGELILVLLQCTQDPEMSNLDPCASKINVSSSYQGMPSHHIMCFLDHSSLFGKLQYVCMYDACDVCVYTMKGNALAVLMSYIVVGLRVMM